MENFLSKMQQRYTVKKYNPAQKVSSENLEALKNILHLSPSSINSQPWKFTFVTNPEIKNQLAEASFFNHQKITDSTCLVVFQVLKNVEDFEKQIQENLPEGAVQYYQNFIKPQGEASTKAWMAHQVYLALGVLLSACAEMNIDSTPMEGLQPEQYDAILNNPKYTTLFAVAIGTKEDEDANNPVKTPKKRLPSELVIASL